MEYKYYNLYGVSLSTDIPLALPPSDEKLDDCIGIERTNPGPWPDDLVPAYDIDGSRMRFRFEKDMEIGLEVDRVTVAAAEDEAALMRTRVYLLGPIMSYLLELRRIVALHASCLALDGSCIAFLSSSGGGKTNLAVAALRAGAALVADDMAAVDPYEGMRVRPAVPQIRLWPADIPQEWGPPDSFPLVHPSFDKRRVPLDGLMTFHGNALPLGCLYVPERSPAVSEVIFEELAPADAMIELIRHSFCSDFVELVGLQPKRLRRLALIVGTVPVVRMTYPNGKDKLPQVWDAVVDDCRKRRP